jgi:chorismate synthase
MLRYLTAGESHGKALNAILEGMVSDLSLSASDINKELSRRQGGYGRGGRMKIEKDEVEILSGVRSGKTLGSPIALLINNKDWANWKDIMAVESGKKSDAVTGLRPGHADLAGCLKYSQKDIRNILERASARETAVRVAVGAIAKKFLKEFNIVVDSSVVSVGGSGPDKIKEEVDKAAKEGDSLGGVFEVVALGCPPGLGSHVHWDRKLKTKLAAALMSIQSIKGVEIGKGFELSALRGSKVHDEIFYEKGKFVHKTNNAGGLEGGITNGEPVVIRAAVKPISTLKKPLKSVDLASKKAVEAHVERADVCAVPAAGVIGEAVVALEIANAVLEKFGGDTLSETRAAHKNYLAVISKI